MLRASSFLFPHGCCAAAVVSVSTVEKESLLFNSSLAIIVPCCAPLLHSCMASPVLSMHSAFSCVPVCMSFMDVQTGMLTEVLIALIFMTNSCYFLVSVFCVVVTGQAVHDVYIWARLVYNRHLV